MKYKINVNKGAKYCKAYLKFKDGGELKEAVSKLKRH